jgi:hypothetical protein
MHFCISCLKGIINQTETWTRPVLKDYKSDSRISRTEIFGDFSGNLNRDVFVSGLAAGELFSSRYQQMHTYEDVPLYRFIYHTDMFRSLL